MGGTMKYFLIKSLGHEILRSMVTYGYGYAGYENFFEEIVKPSGRRSYIFNVYSLI